MIYKDLKSGICVIMTEQVIRSIYMHCKASPTKETGGILIGYYAQNLKDAYITEATPKPSDSIYGLTWFNRGITGLKEILIKRWSKGHYYLGEWHFHPGRNSIPSYTDTCQMRSISKNTNYKCPEPILVIVSLSDSGFTLSLYVLLDGYMEVLLA